MHIVHVVDPNTCYGRTALGCVSVWHAQAAHTGMTYNVSCINSLVVYVGSQAILQLNNKTPIITHSAPMDVFHQVCNYVLEVQSIQRVVTKTESHPKGI